MDKKLLTAVNSKIRQKHPQLPKGKIWSKNDQYRIHFNFDENRETTFSISFFEKSNKTQFKVHGLTNKLSQKIGINYHTLATSIEEAVTRFLRGYNSPHDLNESRRMKFPDSKTYYKLKKKLLKNGFRTFQTYQIAKERGFNTYESYIIAKEFNLSKEEYEFLFKEFQDSDYRTLKGFLMALKEQEEST